MALPNEADLAAWARKRDEQLYSRLLLNRSFGATVIAVRGRFPQLEIQVRRDGEDQSDGHWHKAAVPGYTPQIGDRVDLVWRDDKVAHVQAPLSSTAFVSQGPARLAPPLDFSNSPASASFSSIPATFTHLWVTWRGRSSAGAPTVLNVQFNNDTGANYDYEGQDSVGTNPSNPFQLLGTSAIRISALAGSALDHSGGSFYIFDYARTGTGMRRLLNYYGWRNDTSGTGINHGGGDWRNTTDPVNKITFTAGTGNLEIFVANLYGI